MSNNQEIEKINIDKLKTVRSDNNKQNLAEIESILSLIDEIEEMQNKIEKKQSEIAFAETKQVIDNTNGKNSTQLKKENVMLNNENNDIKEQVASIKEELSKLNKIVDKNNEKCQIVEDFKNEVTNVYNSIKTNIPVQAKELLSGDNALILENIYSGLASEIESMKRFLAEEMTYVSTQNQAIYEDLSDQINKSGNFDGKAFEDRLSEISQIKATDIKVLEEKLDKMNQLDLDTIADKVVERLNSGLLLSKSTDNTEELTNKILEKISLSVQDNAKANLKIEELSNDIKALKEKLDYSSKESDDSEFGLLDYEIREYLKNISQTALKDLLVESRNLKNKALKYLENGNINKSDNILNGLRARFKKVFITGSSAINDVLSIMESYNIPLKIKKDKINSLKNKIIRFEQASIVPDIEQVNDIIRSKKETFADSELTVLDKQTFDEILIEAKSHNENGIDGVKVAKLKQLKRELMSFTLNSIFDFDIVRIGSEITDTDLLLAEIKALKVEIKQNNSTQEKPKERQEISILTDELSELAKIATAPQEDIELVAKKKRAKSKKILRPAIIGNTTEKESPLQPLTIKKNKIKISQTESPTLLSNELVKKLAENMASKIGKK